MPPETNQPIPPRDPENTPLTTPESLVNSPANSPAEDNPGPGDSQSHLLHRNWSEKLRHEEPVPTLDQLDPAARELHRRGELFNAQAHRAIQDIPIPADLRQRILASNKVVVVPFWRTPRAIALAAALAFLATGLVFWATAPREDRTFAGFRSRMVGFALREYRMDIHTRSLPEVKQYLAQNGAPSEFNLPPALAQATVKGGATLTWQGRPVSMICFEHPETTLYMFVIDSVPPTENAGRVESFKNIGTAVWTSGSKTFLLAGNIPLENLERLVKS